MYTNRFISLLVAMSVFAVTLLVVRNATATASPAANVDSATHSYSAWAKAVEAEASTVDSATHSYIAQAKAVTCGVDAIYGLNLGSATRSYIAWAKSLESGMSCQ